MEKVKLLKEVAVAFENAKANYDERDIIRRASNGGFPLEYKRLNRVPPETLVRAYYFGYEIETPEDIVKNLYNNYLIKGEGEPAFAIKNTLNAYGIRVQGIN